VSNETLFIVTDSRIRTVSHSYSTAACSNGHSTMGPTTPVTKPRRPSLIPAAKGFAVLDDTDGGQINKPINKLSLLKNSLTFIKRYERLASSTRPNGDTGSIFFGSRLKYKTNYPCAQVDSRVGACPSTTHPIKGPIGRRTLTGSKLMSKSNVMQWVRQKSYRSYQRPVKIRADPLVSVSV
jgi:hypothetical protein